MDEKQLHYEFMSIISENHPGLTFEEYRDSCVFLLFYHYQCLCYDDVLEEQYKLGAMVRLAVRGKLQMPVFLKFIENASPFLHLAGSPFLLTDFSFYRRLSGVQQLEKQKSFARFFRKLIKKIDAWEERDLLLEQYGNLMEDLLLEFSRMKKETYISKEVLSLYRMLFEGSGKKIRKVFLPDFQYGVLFPTMLTESENVELVGYEEKDSLLETMTILYYMKRFPKESVHFYSRESWEQQTAYRDRFDAISIFMPEGVEPGNIIMDAPEGDPVKKLIHTKTKGEFPFILSALPLLEEHGVLAVVVPSALLYREGKETQIRKYLVEEANCLDAVFLLPDQFFQSIGQNEVLLFLEKNRERRDVMFFDCTEMETLEEDQRKMMEDAWKERKNIRGFCASVSPETIEKNDYNLNLPRYISHPVRLTKVDLEIQKKRIEEIDRELEEIEQRIKMYRRDLNLEP